MKFLEIACFFILGVANILCVGPDHNFWINSLNIFAAIACLSCMSVEIYSLTDD